MSVNDDRHQASKLLSERFPCINCKQMTGTANEIIDLPCGTDEDVNRRNFVSFEIFSCRKCDMVRLMRFMP